MLFRHIPWIVTKITPFWFGQLHHLSIMVWGFSLLESFLFLSCHPRICLVFLLSLSFLSLPCWCQRKHKTPVSHQLLCWSLSAYCFAWFLVLQLPSCSYLQLPILRSHRPAQCLAIPQFQAPYSIPLLGWVCIPCTVKLLVFLKLSEEQPPSSGDGFLENWWGGCVTRFELPRAPHITASFILLWHTVLFTK